MSVNVWDKQREPGRIHELAVFYLLQREKKINDSTAACSHSLKERESQTDPLFLPFDLWSSLLWKRTLQPPHQTKFQLIPSSFFLRDLRADAYSPGPHRSKKQCESRLTPFPAP